jgi:hypothetical protein
MSMAEPNMHDPCKAGLWDIDPQETCPVCGALPDTDCADKQARIKWLQDKLAWMAPGSRQRRRYEDELWSLLD